MMETGYALAFMGGLTGGFGHCLGMCGPVAASLGVQASRGAADITASAVFDSMLYNLGRVLTYSILGVLMGFAGSFLDVAGRMAGIQGGVLFLAGLAMVVMGLDLLGIFPIRNRLERHGGLVLFWVGRFRSHIRRSRLAYLPIGLVLGFLPCGLSYTFLIAAAGAAQPVRGGLLMLCFGVGTLPAMMMASAGGALLGARARGVLFKFGGLFVILSGLYLLYLGFRFHAQM